MNEVAKVFLATNSDYKYTDVSIHVQFTVRWEAVARLFKSGETDVDELILAFETVSDLSLCCVLTENHDLPV